ncbi:MAG TPA: zinc ribbon domain-containing protein [Clostridiales bacterium]|nr:zinc ribbon domain-containing protein [Clostridiales bacterium]
MAFCGKCGAKNDDGVAFCSACGAPLAAPEQPAAPGGQPNDFNAKFQNLNNTADTTSEYSQQDIDQNKGMAVLSYLGLLVLVPIFAAPQSKFARFHANQGLLLLIAEVAYGIVRAILLAILKAIFPWNLTYGYLGGRGVVFTLISVILGLVWLVFTALAIIGIINTVNGKAKELPVIGKFRVLK